MSTWEFELPAVIELAGVHKTLRAIMAEAGHGAGSPDSVLAQIYPPAFDPKNPERDLTSFYLFRVCLVPAKVVPRVYKLIEAERAKMDAKNEGGAA